MNSSSGAVHIPYTEWHEVAPGNKSEKADPAPPERCCLSNPQVEYVEYFQYSRGVAWDAHTTPQLRAWHVLSGGATIGSGQLEDALPGFDRSLYLELEVRDLADDAATIGSSPGTGNTTSLLDAVAGAHTLGGCRCQNPWSYYTDTFPGTCGNPDGDSGGTWCA